MMEHVKGKLKYGIKIGDAVHKDFELREALVQDMVDAEKETPPTDLHAFNVQMLCLVMVRVGDFKGPFTPQLFLRLKRADYNLLIHAMLEADKAGEPAPGDATDL